jgi:DNA-binding transcriptional ArsR family regulator
VDATPFDRALSALADPRRRAMVERLCVGEASVTELAGPVGMRLPSALKHLRALEEGGIVVSHKAGRTRTYQISPSAFSLIHEWVAARRAAMHEAFDRLERAMAELPEETDE